MRNNKMGTMIKMQFQYTQVELFSYFSHWARVSPLGSSVTTGLLYQPQMIDDGDCGAIDKIKIDRGN
jgi:hypothetical protein